ncbi:hypothetical protein HKA85_01870, partial [Vibrio parahaemolyticus]|uniref:hypothetical protein n=1 Tax=Vibrio parahaemolyticus TaxID=670 RepID=UPI00146CA586
DLTDLSDKVVLLSKLNNLSKCQKINKEACNVIALVKERLNFWDNCDKKVKLESDDELTLFCSPILLRLALDNLISNAIALYGKSDLTLCNIPKIRFVFHSSYIDLDEC